jgi:hypothetical protein
MIPAMPVAKCVVVEMISTELVPARKPVVFTDVALGEMCSAVVDAGKMTSTAVTTSEVSPATPVSTTMTGSGVATAMTTTMTTTRHGRRHHPCSMKRRSPKSAPQAQRPSPKSAPVWVSWGPPREHTVGNVNPKTFKLQYRCKNPPADRYRLA